MVKSQKKKKKKLFPWICKKKTKCHFELHPEGCQHWTTVMVDVTKGLPILWKESCRSIFVYEDIT